jgi:hypothetical protein
MQTAQVCELLLRPAPCPTELADSLAQML